jgi:hypothetical protein
MKRALGEAGPATKRYKTGPSQGGAASASGSASGSALDILQSLPPELLLLIVSNLNPRECQPLRLTCKGLRDIVNSAAADTLTVTDDLAQHLLQEQAKHGEGALDDVDAGGKDGKELGNGWVGRLLAKFPRVKSLDVKCSQSTLTLFAKHMVRDSMLSGPAAVPLQRIVELADNVKTNSRRHSAVLLCELLKAKVAHSLVAKPPNYEAMRHDPKAYNKAEQVGRTRAQIFPAASALNLLLAVGPCHHPIASPDP